MELNFIKNSSVLVIGTLISNILAYIFHFISGRILGPEQYGTMGSIIAYFTIISIPFTSFSGAVTKFTIEYSEIGDYNAINELRKKSQKHILVIFCFFIPIMFLISPFLFDFLNVNSILPAFFLIGMVITNSLYTLNSSTLLGLRRYYAYSSILITESAIRLLSVYILIQWIPDWKSPVIAYSIAYGLCFLGIFPLIEIHKVSTRQNSKIEMMRLYHFAFSSMILYLIFQLIINIPTFIIAHLNTKSFTGYWIASMNIARFSLFVSSTITQIIFNELAANHNKIKRNEILRKGAVLIFISHLIFAIIFNTFSSEIIQIVYGSDYQKSEFLLGIISFLMIPVGMLQLLIANHLTRNNKSYNNTMIKA